MGGLYGWLMPTAKLNCCDLIFLCNGIRWSLFSYLHHNSQSLQLSLCIRFNSQSTDHRACLKRLLVNNASRPRSREAARLKLIWASCLRSSRTEASGRNIASGRNKASGRNIISPFLHHNCMSRAEFKPGIFDSLLLE